jgi:hypothetical protein
VGEESCVGIHNTRDLVGKGGKKMDELKVIANRLRMFYPQPDATRSHHENDQGIEHRKQGVFRR